MVEHINEHIKKKRHEVAAPKKPLSSKSIENMATISTMNMFRAPPLADLQKKNLHVGKHPHSTTTHRKSKRR